MIYYCAQTRISGTVEGNEEFEVNRPAHVYEGSKFLGTAIVSGVERVWNLTYTPKPSPKIGLVLHDFDITKIHAGCRIVPAV